MLVVSSWSVLRGNDRLGPYPFDELRAMAGRGEVARDELVLEDGALAPRPAGTVAGLFAPAPSTPAPREPWLLARLVLHAIRTMAWNLRTIPITAAEQHALVGASVDDAGARAYLAWRRSVLVVTAIIAAVAAGLTCYVELRNVPELTTIGYTVLALQLATGWVAPIAAAVAARRWLAHHRSRRALAIGWIVAFLAPLAIALVPFELRFETGDKDRVTALQVVGALVDYVTLMPLVLSVIPGVMRACLRVKLLLPASMLPGWFLVAAAPLWVVMFLIVFAIIGEVTTNPLLEVAVVLLAAAPLLYLRHRALFTAPATSADDEARLLAVHHRVRLLLEVGVACLIVWLFWGRALDRHVIGLDEATSLLRPWSVGLYRIPLEFAAHSLLTMALVADLMMAMNLALWIRTRAFVATAGAGAYDVVMTEIEEAGRN
jgi:hypothetical protein